MDLKQLKIKKEFERACEGLYVNAHDYERCAIPVTGKCTCSTEEDREELWIWIVTQLKKSKEEGVSQGRKQVEEEWEKDGT